MENGYDDVKLADKFSGLAVTATNIVDNDHDHDRNNNDNLYQVIKAVEAAEATIKQQVEENTRLRNELQNKILELDRYRVDGSMAQRHTWNGRGHESAPDDRFRNMNMNMNMSMNNASIAPSGPIILHQDLKPNTEATATMQSHAESNTETSTSTSTSRPPPDNAFFSLPSTLPFSPGRYQMEEHDARFNLTGQGLMPITEVNNSSNLWKQDLAVKIREQEEEIMQLRKHLADYSVKEAQIRNEKYVLEKRIAYMRLAFDQQQQDLVDAASKALSYRQDIIEENIRLSYALQDAQQERSTFISSLLPLLSEYSLQPPVPDAQSIVSNVKFLFKHLQEKLLLTESKLKESQYQLTPWRSDVNHPNFAPQSPAHTIGAPLMTSNKNELELVPQPTHSHGKIPISTSDAQTVRDWDPLSHHHSGLGGVAVQNLEPEDLGRYSPLASRIPAARGIPGQLAVTQSEVHPAPYGEEITSKQVTFREPVSNSEMDDPESEANQNERESSANWSSGNSPYTTTIDDPGSSYSPYLTPVLEEPSSSFSEAADDDPLPAIEGLQISGEAVPGRELQACGYSINGTTSCNFEWVRHMEDGSVNYIDGAKQPNYLVTADDVETYLAIEVQPLDNRKRKGELVKVFANDNKRITCDPEMQNHIEKTLYTGHASYRVSYSTGYLDIWEPATLSIKREGYNIKCSGPSGVVASEKFSPSTNVTIPYGPNPEFLIIGSGGVEHLLRADSNSTDVSSSRDTIVLTLRLFIRRAGEKRKGKKRGIFFNK
ncbi:hypothetical protein ACB098_04G058500 [Castanea mollissima]|uniref:Uncharacterized protein n=1 Tax=Castanea mollissima TaxID=60419 RepID=A0A8J4RCW3_9ROSI|nr:hypothetical protein CMV_005477 [Castanea mollissima]